MFEQTFNPTNPDQWLREFRQDFHQWLDSVQKPPREAILTELVLSKLPAWLEAQMRNLDCQTYEELTETIVRHLGNSKLRRDKSDRKKKEQYRYAKDTPSRFGKKEPPKRTDGPPARRQEGLPQYRDMKLVECYKCGKKGHYQRDCKVKAENAKCSLMASPRRTKLPEWTQTVKINGKEMKALLDTGCTKTLVHPRCIYESDYLGWNIPYNTASEKRTHFPGTSVTLEVEGKITTMAVGVSEHISEDMLMGRDIPHFRKYLRKVLDVEPEVEEESTPPTPTLSESGMAVTRAQHLKQNELTEKERLQQERNQPVISAPYPVEDGSEAEADEEKEEDAKDELESLPPAEWDNEESEGAAEKLEGVLTKDELSRAQRYDTTLKIIREKARVREGPYYWADSLLMRKPYHPQGKALVNVPAIARTQGLRMAHNTPIAGHFGKERTLQAIRERMDWPGIAKDVTELCASCPTCQKAKPAIITKAPLHLLPIQKEPFARMAMDVLGPLPPTKAGNKYILVVMDYHTKWPEAFALRNVTSETVVNFLIEITARTGIPEELLTDNGSNFISKTMQRYCEIQVLSRSGPPHTICKPMVWWSDLMLL